MDVLQQEMTEFVDTVHDDGRCLGAVSTFDNDVSMGQMQAEASSVKSTINGLSPNGGTALYDSLVQMMRDWQVARIKQDRRDVPALLVTVTDGKENESDATLTEVREAIRATGFVPELQCYFVIVGVGSDVSEQQLRDICADGHGVYEHVNNMEEVMRLIVAATLVAIVGAEKYQEIEKKADEMSVKEIKREFVDIGVTNLDYMLNIDTSGSMSDAA